MQSMIDQRLQGTGPAIWKILIITVVLALLLLAGVALAETEKSSKPISAAENDRARNYFTDTPLITQKGKNVRFYSDVLEGRGVVLINVMYSNCEGACPMLTQMLARVSEKLGPRFGKEIFFVSISNDPLRDTPERLEQFIEKQKVKNPAWTFLTGNKDQVDYVIKKLGLYSEKFEEHTALMIAGNTRTGHWTKLQPNMPLDAIMVKLQQLADEG